MALNFTYQWLRDNVAIQGATSPDYTVSNEDAGHTLTFKVEASNNLGASVAISLPFPIPIASNAPVNTSAPTIDRAVVGSASTISQGTWNGSLPINYTYQWYVNAAPVGGATNQTYTPVSGDSGKSLYGIVTAHNSVGNTSAQSNTFTVSGASSAPTNVVAPVLSSAALGIQSTSSNGTWNGTTPFTYTYQWYINAAPISGQTSSNYTPVSGDVGKTLYCAVTATNTVGNATANSNSLTVSNSSFIAIPDATALYAMLSAGPGVSGGKTYLLSATDFGVLGVYNFNFDSNPIVISGQTGTRVQYMEISGTTGITWENFTVYGSNASFSGSGISVHDGGATTMTFTNIISDTGLAQGSQSGGAYYFRNLTNSNITVNGQNQNSIIDIQGRAYAVAIVDAGAGGSLNFNGLTVDNTGITPFLGANASNANFDRCYAQNQYWGDGDHPNGFHFFGDGDGASNHIRITNCGIQKGIGLGSQCYLMEGVDTMLIQNCWGYVDTQFNCFANSAGSNHTNDNNFGQGFTNTGRGGNMITRGGAVNTVCTNNSISIISNYAADGVNPGYIPNPLPGSNVITPDVASYGDYTHLDAWLTAHPTARRRN
jgi:hypothetical protein